MSTESGNIWMRLCGVAAWVLALAVGWKYHDESMAPLRQREKEVQREIADLKGRIEGAQKVVAESAAREKDGARLKDELERLQKDYPEGSAMVWLPGLVKEHFDRAGITGLLSRLSTTQPEPDLPGHERGFWSMALKIDASGQRLATLLNAATDLDQRNSFVRVVDFSIRTDPENPSGRVGWFNVEALFRR